MEGLSDFHKQEHQKYLNMNDDEILEGLTEQELQQLNLHFDEIDPDVSFIPIVEFNLRLIFLYQFENIFF